MHRFNIRPWALAAAIAAASGLLATLAGAVVLPSQLYRSLLEAPLENGPSGRQGVVADFPVRSDAASLGLVGAVRITFPGYDSRARITYYVFNGLDSAVAYTNRFIGLPPRSGTRLPHPPNAQCDVSATGGGYCNMIVADSSVAVVTESSAPPESGSAPLLVIAFDHLNQVVKAAPQYRP